MRLGRRRYYPFPAIEAAYAANFTELLDLSIRGQITPRDLQAAHDAQHHVFRDAILYACEGKDRRKLGPAYAAECIAEMRRAVEQAARGR